MGSAPNSGQQAAARGSFFLFLLLLLERRRLRPLTGFFCGRPLRFIFLLRLLARQFLLSCVLLALLLCRSPNSHLVRFRSGLVGGGGRVAAALPPPPAAAAAARAAGSALQRRRLGGSSVWCPGAIPAPSPAASRLREATHCRRILHLLLQLAVQVSLKLLLLVGHVGLRWRVAGGCRGGRDGRQRLGRLTAMRECRRRHWTAVATRQAPTRRRWRSESPRGTMSSAAGAVERPAAPARY